MPTILEGHLVLLAPRPYRVQMTLAGAVEESAWTDEMASEFRPGDPVIFRVTKQTTHPGPRAVDVHPAQSGETYSYQVDKFWTVREVQDKDVLLITRRGKQRSVPKDDIRLRHARWWERWVYANRFPKLSQMNDLPTTSTQSMD